MVRKSLEEKVRAAGQGGAGRGNEGKGKQRVATGVNLELEVLNILKRVAVHRSTRGGGRISVSGVIEDLVRENWERLENELTD
jgi:hypothetical protein